MKWILMSFLLEQQYACLSPPRYLKALVAKLIISLLWMFAQADTKYLWNRLLLEELIENKVSFYIKLRYLFHQLELIPKCTNSSGVQKLLQSAQTLLMYKDCCNLMFFWHLEWCRVCQLSATECLFLHWHLWLLWSLAAVGAIYSACDSREYPLHASETVMQIVLFCTHLFVHSSLQLSGISL